MIRYIGSKIKFIGSYICEASDFIGSCNNEKGFQSDSNKLKAFRLRLKTLTFHCFSYCLNSEKVGKFFIFELNKTIMLIKTF